MEVHNDCLTCKWFWQNINYKDKCDGDTEACDKYIYIDIQYYTDEE